MSTPNAYKLIVSNIEQLDEEMTSHQEECEACSETTGLCQDWADMVENWNFYHLALLRTARLNFKEQYETEETT